MQSRPWPPRQDATDVDLTSVNPRIEAALRRMGQQLNNLIRQYNALLAQVQELPKLETWPGSENLIKLGTVTTGTWQATPIADSYVASANTWHGKQNALTFGSYSVIAVNGVVALNGDEAAPGAWKYYGTDGDGVRAWFSLEEVLGTWVGSETLDTLGTVITGTWQATPIADDYVASAATWSAKQDALTFGNYSIIELDGEVGLYGDLADPGFLMYYGTDYDGAKGWVSLDETMSYWMGGTSIDTVGTITTGTWKGTPIADDYVASAATWSGKQDALTFIDSLSEVAGIVGLAGDVELPGVGQYYGTDGSGARGWLDLLTAIDAATTFQHSLTRSAGKVNLVNDSDSPGNSKLYGTNASGVRGWYDQPSDGASFPSGTAYELLTWDNDASDVVSRDLAGTTNQITVTNSLSTITLSLPQNIHKTAEPEFAALKLTGGGITMSW